MAVQDLARIEEKLDKVTAGAVAISDHVGGVMFTNMAEVMEFAKLLSLAGTAVPKHLRGNPGGCLAVTIQALEWRMSPIAVANKSYEVNDRIAYESQLIHGVIEARAPLKQRLRGQWEGEGPARFCIVTGHLKGEVEPVEYRSPTVEKIKVKNSPLWTSDPDQQLWYYASRAWARRYCPDVLLGIYSEEELRESGGTADHAVDITPKVSDLAKRLTGGKKKQGFDGQSVETQAASLSAASEPVEKPAAIVSAKASELQKEPPQDKQLTEDAPAEETSIARGARLIALCKAEKDVDDLWQSIADELEEAQQGEWDRLVSVRRKELKAKRP